MPRSVPEWLILGGVLAVPVGALLTVLWEGSVRPRLIPDRDIERMASGMRRLHGSAAAFVAALEEDHARRYSHAFEAARLRRVREALERGF